LCVAVGLSAEKCRVRQRDVRKGRVRQQFGEEAVLDGRRVLGAKRAEADRAGHLLERGGGDPKLGRHA
jgi:hypothetical protein